MVAWSKFTARIRLRQRQQNSQHNSHTLYLPMFRENKNIMIDFQSSICTCMQVQSIFNRILHKEKGNTIHVLAISSSWVRYGQLCQRGIVQRRELYTETWNRFHAKTPHPKQRSCIQCGARWKIGLNKFTSRFPLVGHNIYLRLISYKRLPKKTQIYLGKIQGKSYRGDCFHA